MEADAPRVLHALPSPLCVITDRHRSSDVLPDVLQSAVRGGARWIRAREPDLDLLAYVALCHVLIDAVADARVTWSVRPSAYVLLRSAWPELRLGVHLTSADPPWRASDAGVPVGRSVHVHARVHKHVHIGNNAAVQAKTDARSAVVPRAAPDEAVDYQLLAPVFHTACKPDAVPAGTLAITRLSRAVSAPGIALEGAPAFTSVVALGGVTPEQVADCLRAGASGVAVCGGVMASDTPDVAVAAYLGALLVK